MTITFKRILFFSVMLSVAACSSPQPQQDITMSFKTDLINVKTGPVFSFSRADLQFLEKNGFQTLNSDWHLPSGLPAKCAKGTCSIIYKNTNTPIYSDKKEVGSIQMTKANFDLKKEDITHFIGLMNKAKIKKHSIKESLVLCSNKECAVGFNL